MGVMIPNKVARFLWPTVYNDQWSGGLSFNKQSRHWILVV